MKGNARDWQTRIRLWAALIMAVYAIGYTIYYALGLISVEWIESYQNFVFNLWPLFWVIPVVILTHVSLGLWKLFRRNTLKMPFWEMAQIALGITIPFFLIPHIIFTYGLFLFFGIKGSYADIILRSYPQFNWQFIGMALAIWLHAQIGVHVVLRMRSFYPKIKLLIFFIFTTMPIIGIGGYFKAGMEMNKLIAVNAASIQIPSLQQIEFLKLLVYAVYIIFPVLYIIVLASRSIRIKIMLKNRNIVVNYSSGKSVNVFLDTTILEASRIGQIPHASICGGRGRCTTCRVKVEKGMENLSAIGEREQKALNRIGAEKDIRLACQAECIKEEISITLLLPPDVKSLKARKETKLTIGKDIELVVVFADLRGFTQLSEEKFPYDVVFILNRYFNYMGEVIENNNGIIDKFLGDGILAYFGYDSDPETACKQALIAAKQMAEKLIEINDQLKNHLTEPLELGIGIHYGEVILGELGYKNKSSITIIGDTVNTTSRLESLNKKAASQMIFSNIVAEKTKLDFSHIKKVKAAVRGRKEPLTIYIVKDIASELKNII